MVARPSRWKRSCLSLRGSIRRYWIAAYNPYMPSFGLRPPQCLLFDADDTLWENNIYFERAIAAFISYLDHRVHTREEVREHLNTCEHATIAKYGYGLASFRRSLITCFEQLSDEPITPEKHARIVSFTESIASSEIELLPAVEPIFALSPSAINFYLLPKAIWTSSTIKSTFRPQGILHCH